MRLLLTALCSFIVYATIGSAEATLHRGTTNVIPATCPFGVSTPDDGCQSAPAPLTASFYKPNAFQLGGYLNTVAGTQANYMAANCGGSGVGNGVSPCRPPWNVAGIDYAIGNYTPCSSTAVSCGDPATVCANTVWDGTCLLDPALVVPPGCAYSATGNAGGGPRLRCSTAGTYIGTISHYNFGPVNSHNCTSIQLNAATSTPTVMDDIYFFNDSGACIDSFNNTEWIRSTGSYTGAITISNSLLDGNGYVFMDSYGSAGCFASLIQCNPGAAIQAGLSALTIKYSVLRNFPTATLHPGNAATIQFSLIEGWIIRSPNGHAEWFDGPSVGAVISTYTLDHTLWINNKFSSQNGPAPVFTASGWPVSIANFNLTNDVAISSFVGGLTGPNSTITGCVGASFSGGSCSGAGAIFFLTSGQAGWGNVLPGSCAAYALGPPAPGSPPAGVISQWWIDGINSGYGDRGQISDSIASCTGTTNANSTGNAVIFTQHGPNPYGPVTVTNNYFDAASFGGPGSQPLYVIGNTSVSSFTGTITTSAGVSTLTSTSALSLANGEYINGVGVGNCNINLVNCPTATGGSYAIGASIPITPAVAAVGPITMSHVQAAWCTTPMVFSGNIDMTAQTPSAWMNQISIRRDSVGC